MPKSRYGAYAFTERAYGRELTAFFETGQGKVYWTPVAEYYDDDRKVVITGFPPPESGKLETALKKLARDDRVSSIVDDSYPH